MGANKCCFSGFWYCFLKAPLMGNIEYEIKIFLK